VAHFKLRRAKAGGVQRESLRLVARRHAEHEVRLSVSDGMEMQRTQEDVVSADIVGKGQTGEMIWRFTKAGEFYFACLMPGHYEAGMMGTIVVAPAKRNP